MSIEETIRQVIQEAIRPLAAKIESLAQATGSAPAADDILTVKQAADIAQLHPTTVRAKCDAGEITDNGKRGRLRRIRRSDLLAYIDGRTPRSTAPVKTSAKDMSDQEAAVAILASRR